MSGPTSSVMQQSHSVSEYSSSRTNACICSMTIVPLPPTPLALSHEDDMSLAVLEITINQLNIERNALSIRFAEVGNALKAAQLRRARIVNRSTRISCIPNELLSTIFMFAKASQEADMDSTGREDAEDDLPISFELLISHVSSHFREVAINTHRLWTSIQMRPGRSLERISTYIRRSGSCPLDIRVDLSGCVHHPGGMTAEMMDIIIPHARRWRCLHIVSEREAAENSMVMRLCNCEVPILEHLSVCVSDVDGAGANIASFADHPRPSILTTGAPKLSFLRLRGLAMHFYRPPLALITTLHLDQTKLLPIQYATFRNILTGPAMLRHLSIYGDIIGPESWPGEMSAIDLPALQSLRICGVGGGIYSRFLLAIAAPHLQSLVLKDVQEHDLDNFWEHADILKFPHLQSVTFCDFDVSDFTYERMFRTFPSITEFTSFHSSFTSSPVSKLLVDESFTESSSVPWPKLHTLSFLFDEDEELNIHDVLEKRKKIGHPLKKLRFGTSCEDDFLQFREELQSQPSVVFERFINVDKWPLDRDYADRDDVLFL